MLPVPLLSLGILLHTLHPSLPWTASRCSFSRMHKQESCLRLAARIASAHCGCRHLLLHDFAHVSFTGPAD